jgi:leucine dehydrogenase
MLIDRTMELGALLESEGLNELRLVRRAGFELTLARRWSDSIDWSRYNHDFSTDSLPCRQPRVLGDRDARALISNKGAQEALAHLELRMAAGRHQMMTLKVHRKLGIRAALFVHSSLLGYNNGLHALRAGGFRRHSPDEPEAEVFSDGLNLARAMSYKNAAADLPLGGCKMTVQSQPIGTDDRERLGFLSFAIDSGRFVTGPDMGFHPDHADAMRAHFTKHVTGGNQGVLGPTGTPTALGCYLAICEAAELWFDWKFLAEKTAAVQGLGAVGLPLAQHLADAGMHIVAADPDPEAVERARAEIPDIEIIDPADILTTECDILAPCAIGGVIDEAMIRKLSCKMLYGSANNPLAATSVNEELRLAEMLQERGILFQIEWTHNTAGVMSGFEEYIRGGDATHEHLHPRLVSVCGEGTRKLLTEARATGRTPTAIAYEQIEGRIYRDEGGPSMVAAARPST